jgi:hypothetical protein
MRPFGAIRLPDLMGSDQSSDAAILDHDETPLTSAKKFVVHEILDAEACVNGRTISCHHIADADALQRPPQADFDVTYSRRLQKEPADECDPQATQAAAAEVLNYTDGEEGCPYRLANFCRSSCRAIQVTGLPPNDRP